MEEHAGGVKLSPAQRPRLGLGCEGPGRTPSPDPFPLVTATDIQLAVFGPAVTKKCRHTPSGTHACHLKALTRPSSPPPGEKGGAQTRGRESVGASCPPPPRLPASGPARRREGSGDPWRTAAGGTGEALGRGGENGPTYLGDDRAAVGPRLLAASGRDAPVRGWQRKEKGAERMSLLAGCGDRPSAERAAAQGRRGPSSGRTPAAVAPRRRRRRRRRLGPGLRQVTLTEVAAGCRPPGSEEGAGAAGGQEPRKENRDCKRPPWVDSRSTEEDFTIRGQLPNRYFLEGLAFKASRTPKRGLQIPLLRSSPSSGARIHTSHPAPLQDLITGGLSPGSAPTSMAMLSYIKIAYQSLSRPTEQKLA